MTDQFGGTCNERLFKGRVAPALISLVMVTLLVKINCHGIYAQGYADDVCNVGEGRYLDMVLDTAHPALMRVGEIKGFPINTDIMIFKKKIRLENLRLLFP